MHRSKNSRYLRAVPRLPAPKTMWLQCWRGDAGDGNNLANGMLDLSSGGVQFLAREPLETGEVVALMVGSAAVPQGLHRYGEVRWVVALGGGACCADVRWLQPLTDGDLQSLLGAGQAPDPDRFVFDPLDNSVPIDLPLR